MTKAPAPRPAPGPLMRSAAWASIGVASGLVVLKAAAWQWTGSVAILASLVDSALDALAAGVNLAAIHFALAPADREHRFGHGKLEAVAALAQATLIAGSAVALSVSAVHRMLHPQPVQATGAGLLVMGIATVATWALVRYQQGVIRATGSVAIRADSLHYTGDLLMNVAVAISLALTAWLGWHALDPACGIVVAGIVARGAWQIVRDAFDVLLDRELPDERRAAIEAAVLAHKEVLGVHDLRTRMSGVQPFVQFELELDGARTLTDAHRICDEVEADVRAQMPGAEVLVHAVPRLGDGNELGALQAPK
ncbi:MAG: cation diffusion facilitator family transporter [Myxococcales bacterium]|nr:cation diffusion facilitator family transporter [Myxococcales bacterium]